MRVHAVYTVHTLRVVGGETLPGSSLIPTFYLSTKDMAHARNLNLNLEGILTLPFDNVSRCHQAFTLYLFPHLPVSYGRYS